MPLEMRAFKTNGWNNSIELYLRSSEDGRTMSFGASVVMETSQEYTEHSPLITLRQNEAQQLMDSLWDCGLRPSEGSGSAGQMAATQRHLEDFRKIAFKFLELPTCK